MNHNELIAWRQDPDTAGDHFRFLNPDRKHRCARYVQGIPQK